MFYTDSLEFKAFEDCETFGEILDENESRVSKEIDTHMRKYNIHGLLKTKSLHHIKKILYKAIIERCPSLFKAWEQVHILERKP